MAVCLKLGCIIIYLSTLKHHPGYKTSFLKIVFLTYLVLDAADTDHDDWGNHTSESNGSGSLSWFFVSVWLRRVRRKSWVSCKRMWCRILDADSINLFFFFFFLASSLLVNVSLHPFLPFSIPDCNSLACIHKESNWAAPMTTIMSSKLNFLIFCYWHEQDTSFLLLPLLFICMIFRDKGWESWRRFSDPQKRGPWVA